MNEAGWLNCTDPRPMLEFLRGKVSERKLRLFAVASFKRLLALLPDPRQHRGIEVLEQLAEGTIKKADCRGVTADVRLAIPRNDRLLGTAPLDDPHYVALMLYREFCSSSIAEHAVCAAGGLADFAKEQHVQARLLLNICGNPFRPTDVDHAWLTSTVLALATRMYDSEDFSTMPILADALQDAGCNEPAILGHCQCEGPHVRGCWVIDSLLGKA